MRYKRHFELVFLLASQLVAFAGGCSDEFPAIQKTSSDGVYTVTLTLPPDLTPGVEAEIEVFVEHDGEGVGGLSPELHYALPDGDGDDIELSEGEEPGHYHGHHTFDEAGDYEFTCSFESPEHMHMNMMEVDASMLEGDAGAEEHEHSEHMFHVTIGDVSTDDDHGHMHMQ